MGDLCIMGMFGVCGDGMFDCGGVSYVFVFNDFFEIDSWFIIGNMNVLWVI